MALSRQPRNCAPSPKLTKTPSEWDAVSFSATESSHVQLFLSRKDIKLFNFTVVFRTFFPNGLILYADNPTREEYLMLALRDGRMVLSVNDEYTQEISSQPNLANGEWHSIHLERKARRIVLRVDNSREEFIKLTKRFVVSIPWFVAGINDQSRLPSAYENSGFRGCLGNFTWNDRNINLLEQKSVQGVGTCYLNVEPAAFFEGNGYATYNENFYPNGKVQVEMDFRTNSLSGELLLLYDPVKRLFVQLKYIDSQVIFNISSNSESFHASKAFPAKHRLCDGEWHHVKALFLQNVMTIDVDHSVHEYAYAKSPVHLELPEGVPLYIGGRPASVPAGIIAKVPNFAGCMRNVAINGKSVVFPAMASLKNVLIDSCPVPLAA